MIAPGGANEGQVLQRLDEIVRLLAILAGRGLPQSRLITELAEAGFEPKRIAEILGTTPNTVSVTLYASRKRRTRKKARRLVP